MRKRKGIKKRTRSDTSAKGKRAVAIKAKKATALKTRNNGRFTESEFWQFIRASLRNRTRFWAPKLEALKQARRPSQSSNKRLKWEFHCYKCSGWFPQTQVEVHHLEPAGKLRSGEDLKDFVEKLFCEKDKLAVICKNCHKLEHSKK